MLTAYIVEDELMARDELKYLLRRSGQVEIVGEAGYMMQAMEDIRSLEPDIVFVDIQLAQGSGLEIAEELARMENAPAVIFATAYDEHALQAFELNAFDYILKPFDEVRIRQTLDKIAKWRKLGAKEQFKRLSPTVSRPERKEKLAVAIDERILMIDMEKIVYVGSEHGQTVVKTPDARYAMNETLVELERKLGPSPFFRVHRNYIVNVNYVHEVQPWFNGTYDLFLQDGTKVPVSRTYVKDLRRILGF